MEQLDCTIIGAGLYGLAAAKQYHVQHLDHKMAVFDSADSIGGIWADHRIYPEMKSAGPLGSYEYPDFPMEPHEFDAKPGEQVPAEIIHTYHHDYASRFGIYSLVRFKSKVVLAEHQDTGGWILTVISKFNASSPDMSAPRSRIYTRRLIVATGSTSEEVLQPYIEGQETFEAPILYPQHFKQHLKSVDPRRSIRITITGHTKVALDNVGVYARKGVFVDWVMGDKGTIDANLNMSSDHVEDTRARSWLSPCVWSDDGGYAAMKTLLHRTSIGRAVRKSLVKTSSTEAKLKSLDSHPDTAKLKKQAPLLCAKLMSCDPDLFGRVQEGIIKIYLAPIGCLSPHQVHLASEESVVLDSEALLVVPEPSLVPPLKFLPDGIEAELGLPQQLVAARSLTDLASQRHLFDKADAQIQACFSALKHHNNSNGDDDLPEQPETLTPLLLYHFTVPPQPRFLRCKDIAFAGFNPSAGLRNNGTVAHIQGLWISSYFDGKLARDPCRAVSDRAMLKQIQYETVLHSQMLRILRDRADTLGFSGMNGLSMPFIDMMMADLGLKAHRKKGWWREMTEGYSVADYRAVNDELNREHEGVSFSDWMRAK